MLRDSMQDKWNLRTLNISFRYNIGDKDFAFQACLILGRNLLLRMFIF